MVCVCVGHGIHLQYERRGEGVLVFCAQKIMQAKAIY